MDEIRKATVVGFDVGLAVVVECYYDCLPDKAAVDTPPRLIKNLEYTIRATGPDSLNEQGSFGHVRRGLRRCIKVKIM